MPDSAAFRVAYKALVADGHAHPSARDIADRAGATEGEFYAAYPTPEACGRAAWVDLYDQVWARISTSATFQSYSTRERMLAYNFTFFEVAPADRSFISATHGRHDLTADYRERFLALHTDWVQEGVAADELRERLSLSGLYPQLLWGLHQRLIDFWVGDTSEQFMQTEKAIEIYSKLPLEFMGTNILDSAFESAKFSAQRILEQLRPERISQFFRF